MYDLLKKAENWFRIRILNKIQAMYFHYYYSYICTSNGEKNNSKNIIAMIPARMGGTANYEKSCLSNGKPLIYYAINAAKDSEVFKRIVINSEDCYLRK